MHILQIGGTGFLGAHIAQRLIAKNHQVSILTRDTTPTVLAAKNLRFDPSEVSWIEGDILNIDEIVFSERYDMIVYTAMVPFKPGRISNRQFKALEHLTQQYFENTISVAQKIGCPLILTSGANFATKDQEIADEEWPIARTGMAALGKCYDELISTVKSQNIIPIIEMLPAQIYGNGGMFQKILSMAKKGKLVILGDGNNYLPRIHVEDCADAYVRVIEQRPIGKKFIICDDQPVTVKNFMTYLGQHYGVHRYVRIPKFILRIAMGKYIYHTLIMGGKVSNQRLKQEIGWKPRYPSYKEGIDSLL
ncbi:hypothetical protein NEF87_003318 [Candidatus Lokiarchaeum ossiferum]|uniref:NAD-dependent epimerase/dehydratase domain-containing protein n=1 Tax=Candidatus Lokiarchaeum ossiferum TaxID=2951803 RepID=A0ABY6HU37_9ARCH|nr:hypothetical protein NEF87_003318 [Candidatus Lokiarchaeum sp. B-35]